MSPVTATIVALVLIGSIVEGFVAGAFFTANHIMDECQQGAVVQAGGRAFICDKKDPQ